MKPRYFDYNATTPLAGAAKLAWVEATEAQWLNPSSPYRQAAGVRVRYEAARTSVAQRIGVDAGRVVFTSGATEANNGVMRYWAEVLGPNARVGINPTEHPSVIEAAKAFLAERVLWLPLLSDGRVDEHAVQRLIADGDLAALSVMAANNETGVIQPWQSIARLCAEVHLPYHCDASQWVGKMPLSGLGDCTYVTACAHKFGGPKGVGFMVLPAAGVEPCRLLYGGAQEAGQRAGTEDVAGVLSMVAALEHVTLGEPAARDAFIAELSRRLPGVQVIGEGVERLWNTVSLIMPEFQSVRWIRSLERAGFLCSAGSACSTGKSTQSSVLRAMGLDSASAGRVLRISSGAETTLADWYALVEALMSGYQALKAEAASSRSQVISID
ncbi:aminotransferase class V-fold PLP-dependent enzyme [Coraliomargarita sp. SDUM461004]|uniref:Aminotransferase class V-fold PLP-dependent enzyme n=1 Tax=Thalassobacterium sedimentorum TaxID=3041258 RepID=A0ABU1AIA2_9BACT|nr:aminotransferase class V-fold PLP-dependent enzyme [Coraliomargarita sp. SDUM461004]MDQ8194422.1 aminotransferase class V-fold PLP-dependent enzyme [Coraliomargarita sp. SDUM461004]